MRASFWISASRGVSHPGGEPASRLWASRAASSFSARLCAYEEHTTPMRAVACAPDCGRIARSAAPSDGEPRAMAPAPAGARSSGGIATGPARAFLDAEIRLQKKQRRGSATSTARGHEGGAPGGGAAGAGAAARARRCGSSGRREVSDRERAAALCGGGRAQTHGAARQTLRASGVYRGEDTA